MRIQYCSDLHLEFYKNYLWLKENPIVKKGDVLIIAGDTAYLGAEFSNYSFFDVISDLFEQVYLIPGNHEYYRGFDVKKHLNYELSIRSNVKLLNNKSVEINGVKFIFTTLWSNIYQNEEAIKSGMADFRYIKSGNQIISVEDYNSLHNYCLEFIKQEVLNNKTEKCFVVTHHLPSMECNAEEFIGSTLNDAFCVDLTSFIENSSIDYWLYGHSHRNKPLINIGQTKLITNQLGYVQYHEHHDFNREAIIEI